MTTRVREILHNIEQLTLAEKQDLVTEVVRRSTAWNSPPLREEELVELAENLFLALDEEEAHEAGTRSR